MADIKLTLFEDTDFYDISIKNGDIELDDSFNTPLILSVFSDARADESEVVPPFLRRGFWGDETSEDPNDPFGSKLWLLDQARISKLKLNRAIDYARKSLNWLVINRFCERINVEGEILGIDTIRLSIQIIIDNNIVETKYYDLWKNSGNVPGRPVNPPTPPTDIIFMLDGVGDYILDNNLEPILLG